MIADHESPKAIAHPVHLNCRAKSTSVRMIRGDRWQFDWPFRERGCSRAVGGSEQILGTGIALHLLENVRREGIIGSGRSLGHFEYPPGDALLGMTGREDGAPDRRRHDAEQKQPKWNEQSVANAPAHQGFTAKSTVKTSPRRTCKICFSLSSAFFASSAVKLFGGERGCFCGGGRCDRCGRRLDASGAARAELSDQVDQVPRLGAQRGETRRVRR